ncbi:hypothetical protein K474DRAFT_1687280 [Panus rudis PR-1116 ss-1]|nr:hypothetical protein K474DRAFT_1687280 [Panus rudis PR-1116 ss-1]
MSSTNDYPGPNPFTTQPPPTHHIHRDSEPLPGARGASAAGANSATYDTNVTNDSQTWKPNNEKHFGAGTDTGAVMAGGQHTADFDSTGAASHGQQQRAAEGRNAFNEDRPTPTSQGGVAVGGRDDLPESHASTTDKLIGKTQKVAGKYLHKPELHEKGKLREAGGKAAVAGQAQAPHD